MIGKMDIEQYAVFIYDVKQFDVNHKIKWDKIKQKLRENDLSNQFWQAYYKEKERLTGQGSKFVSESLKNLTNSNNG